jgi:hypothetical protein
MAYLYRAGLDAVPVLLVEPSAIEFHFFGLPVIHPAYARQLSVLGNYVIWMPDHKTTWGNISGRVHGKSRREVL